MLKRKLLLLVPGLLLISVGMVSAQSSANYVMQRFVMVGGGSADSANYAVASVFGQPATDVVNSANYKVSAGFLRPSTCVAGNYDVNGDGGVTVTDIQLVALNWYQTNYAPATDVDCNGVVDIRDIGATTGALGS